MKRKLLSTAISAIALAGFAQSSQATNYVVYLAGSSAQDNLVMAEAANLCVANSSNAYYIDNNFSTVATGNGGNGNNYKALTCAVNTAKLTSGFTSADTITVYKTNLGGSAQGVDPLWNGTVPNFMTITGCTASGTKSLGTIGAVNQYICPSSVTFTGSLDLGIADVNPAMFQGVNQATAYNPTNGNVIHAFSPITTNTHTGVTVVAGPALIWGVPVSLNLYTALQAAQGLLNVAITATGVTLPAGSCSAGQATDACMPSLSKAQVTSVLTGTLFDWSKFNFNGVNLLDAATAYSAAILPTGGDTTVNFCQRTAGSGTAASQYAYFMNQPANGNATLVLPAPAFNTGTSDTVANNVPGLGAYVYSLQDGGNMENCLVDLATGSTSAVNYAGATINTSGNTAWAIGQQSTDKNTSASKQYRFIKLAGVAPTYANVYSGAYDFVNESTWQYPASRTTQSGAVVAALVAAQKNPATISADLNSPQPFGAAGFMVTLANALSFNSAYTLPTTVSATAPVTPWSRNANFNTTATGLDNGTVQVLNPAATVAP